MLKCKKHPTYRAKLWKFDKMRPECKDCEKIWEQRRREEIHMRLTTQMFHGGKMKL